MTGGSRSQKDYDFEYEGSLGKDQTPSNSEAHGSHDRLIPTSSEPLAGTIFDTPTSVADLSATEQYLIYSLRQLNLGGWASGDKSVLPLNKTEQEIIDLAFAMSATDQMTDLSAVLSPKCVLGITLAFLPYLLPRMRNGPSSILFVTGAVPRSLNRSSSVCSASDPGHIYFSGEPRSSSIFFKHVCCLSLSDSRITISIQGGRYAAILAL
uniref:Uncharacterized protein n=1 Tax=Talaromyces marneffei PM1 TaxID=1077442 RepID=A0A093UVC2_TALMA